MSNKHLACMILTAFIVGAVQLGLIMHKKMTAARENQELAENALQFAVDSRGIKEIQLTRLKQETAPLRRFLTLWLPRFEETNDQTKSRAIFSRVFKQHGEGLVSHADRSSPIGNKGKTFIPERFQNIISVEGDFATAIGLIGQIEKEMPASRITTLNISKGTRGSDVRLSMTVESPVMAKSEANAPKK
jgi:hypothetical protein